MTDNPSQDSLPGAPAPLDPASIDPAVSDPSIHGGTNFRSRSTIEHLRLSLYWLATNFHWGALLFILMPRDAKVLSPEHPAQLLGNIIAAGAIVALVVPLIVGALTDRSMARIGRRRPYMLTGTLVNVLGLGLMVAGLGASSIPLYFLGFVVVQFGSNIASAAYMGVIPDLVVSEERGKASGFMALMSQVGTLLGAIAMGILLGHVPSLYKYVVVALMLVGFLWASWSAIDERPLNTKPAPLHWVSYLKALWIDPRAYPDFAWVWITRFLVMVGFYAVMPFVNYYLNDVIDIPYPEVDGTAPKILGIILIFAAISGVYGGNLSDRIGRKRVVYIANAVIALFAVAFIFCRTLPQAMIVGVLFGLGYGAYISVDYALGTDVLPSKKEAGKDMAVWHIAMTLPQSLAAPLAAFLLAIPGKTLDPVYKVEGQPLVHYTHTGYALIFGLCAVCFALGAILLKNVRGVR